MIIDWTSGLYAQLPRYHGAGYNINYLSERSADNMGYETQRAAIEGRMESGWTSTPIAYEEIPYKPTPGQPFVKLWIVPGVGIQKSIGDTPWWRFQDSIQVDIFVPAGKGTKTVSDYADEAIELFKGQQFMGVQVFNTISIHRDREGEWLKWAIIFDTMRNET